MKCIKCNKILKKIGTKKPLKNHNGKDWETRQLHKTCWKDLKELQDICISQINLTDEQLTKSVKDFKIRWGLKKLL
jgi:hypothetical protein